MPKSQNEVSVLLEVHAVRPVGRTLSREVPAVKMTVAMKYVDYFSHIRYQFGIRSFYATLKYDNVTVCSDIALAINATAKGTPPY